MTPSFRALALLALLLPPLGPATAAEPPQVQPPAPVRLGGRTLFEVRAGFGSLTPAERARAIEERIAGLPRDPSFGPGTLRLDETSEGTLILSGRQLLVGVLDADASAAGVPRDVLARQIADAIRDGVAAERLARSGVNLARNLLVAGVALLGLLVVLRLLAAGMRALGRRADALLERQIQRAALQHVRLVAPETARRWTAAVGRVVRLLVYLVPCYAFLLVVLGLFPVTLGWAAYLLAETRHALAVVGLGVVGFLPRLLSIALIGLVAYLAIRVAKSFFRAVEEGHVVLPAFDADWAIPTFKLVRILLIAFAVIVMAPYLPGFGSGAFQGVTVFLGLLLSLGSSSAVANAVAGTILTYTGAFRVGDRVKIGETVGDVVEKSLLVTRVRTIKNVVVTLPNGTVLSGSMVNYSAAARAEGLILNTSVTIGYDAPWRTVHALLIAAARDTEGILDDPAPFVLQTSLNDFHISYEVNAVTRDAQRMVQLYSDLHRNIQDRFTAAGVEIMSPHYNSLRDGNRPALPPAEGAAAAQEGVEAPARRR